MGRWEFKAKLKSANGEWQTLEGTWLGHYILDGYAIADEYRMTRPSGELMVLGMNFRTYDAAHGTWNIRWLDALAGTWTDLVSAELGGARFDGRSVTYVFKEPMASHSYTRASYLNVSDTHFTWRGEKSEDMKTWAEFMILQAYRADNAV